MPRILQLNILPPNEDPSHPRPAGTAVPGSESHANPNGINGSRPEEHAAEPEADLLVAAGDPSLLVGLGVEAVHREGACG